VGVQVNFLLAVLKIVVTIVCFFVGCAVGILEMLFYDRRRHNLDS